MANNNFEDAPFGIFKTGYSAFAWLSTLVLVFLTVWTLWIMFMTTPAGTRRSQQLVEMKPTQEAIAEEAIARLDPCRPAKPAGVSACLACHVIEGMGGGEVCPSLTDIRTVALERLEDPGYQGSAKTAEEYIRESVLQPSVYVVESPAGKAYGSPGASIMPERGGLADGPEFEKTLDELVAWVTYDPDAVCEDEVASR